MTDAQWNAQMVANLAAEMERQAAAMKVTPTPTIEERRSALKPGDVIKDPALLCAGMVLDTGEGPTRTLTSGMEFKYNASSGVVFLGYAADAKPAEVVYASYGRPPATMDNTKPPAKCAPTYTAATPCRTMNVCPVWREDRTSRMMRLTNDNELLLDEQKQARQRRADFAAWLGTYEPPTNGRGGMVGQYRVKVSR